MELLLESKDGEIAALNDQVLRLGQRNRVLESSLGELEERIHGLESGLGRKEGEILGLEERLGEKQGELAALAAKNKSSREQIDGLCEAVSGLERQRGDWEEKEKSLLAEIQKMGFMVEEKSSALRDAVSDASKSREMCRSLEAALEQRIQAKNVELEVVKKEIQVKDAQLVRLNEDVYVLQEKNRGMKSAIETLEHTVATQSQRLASKDAELTNFEVKTSSLQATLCGREEEIQSLTKNRKTLMEQNELLKQAVQKLEERKIEWIQQEESLRRQVQELAILLEEKCDAVNAATKEARDENKTIQELESSIAERNLLMAERNLLGQSLASCQEELASLRTEKDQQVELLRETLSAVEYQLKETVDQLQTKTSEMELVIKELSNTESQLSYAKQEIQHLTERHSSLDFTIQSLQLKVSTATEELRRSEARGQHLFSELTTAELKLAESKEMVTSLQLKVDLGNQITAKMQGANAKIKELETLLAELMAFAQDKDEKLDASEWAVQQLGLIEVSKAKANLERAERERVELKNRCSELEDELKVKEEELLDMESCLSHLRREHEKNSTNVEDYRAEKRSFEIEIERLERELSSSLEDASITSSKLKEIQCELQRTQLSSKCLVQQMLMLHENLLQDGKALLEIGKAEVSPISSMRSTRDSSLSASKVFDESSRRESMDFEGKENVPSVVLSSSAKTLDNAAKCIDSKPVERAPFQVLDVV